MNPRRRRIVIAVAVMLIGVGTAAALALRAFQENLLYFYSPTLVAAGEAPANRKFRIGGLVVPGSVMRNPDTLAVSFALTDTLHQVRVNYEGILPDLFREGQGIVANGELLADGTFGATEVLAKHDENYMPPEVADALKAAGSSLDYSKFKHQQ
ncbi:MAG: cytochrome c maturation protein CcmE [Gammaproteobacteria bacterium]|nr:cytochrome c maturation protein CcmE [Gammaproteobacteria bacterium]